MFEYMTHYEIHRQLAPWRQFRTSWAWNTTICECQSWTMNIQQQPNGNDCGLYAVAFATALVYGQDPTEEDYCDLRSYFLNCMLSHCLTQFPSSVVYRKPKVLQMIEPSFCSCGRGDDGRLMIECKSCGEWFHSQRVGGLSAAEAENWKCSSCMQWCVSCQLLLFLF